MQKFAKNIVQQPLFENSIIILILLNAAIVGLETAPTLVEHYGNWFEIGHHLILSVFIFEAILKITAVAPRFKLYFGDGWNLFDFSVIL